MSNSENDKLNYSEDIMIEKVFWLCVNNSPSIKLVKDHDYDKFDEYTYISYSDNTLSISYENDRNYIIYEDFARDFDLYFPVSDLFFFINTVFPNTKIGFLFHFDYDGYGSGVSYNLYSKEMRFLKEIGTDHEFEEGRANTESGLIEIRSICDRKTFFEHMIAKANASGDRLLADFLSEKYNSIYFPDNMKIVNSELDNKKLLWAAFYGCKDLVSISIPENLTCIPDNLFYNCANLIAVTIPDSVTSIGNGAFSNCKSLTSVTIPYSVASIGNHAFSECTKLESVTIEDGVKSIGRYAFSKCKNLTSVVIPGSVTSIEYSAFSECTKLESVTIEDGVKSIGRYAFSKCKNLTSVVIPGSVTSIEYSAFSECTKLESFTIENGVKSIEGSAFYNCINLTSVTIPDSVTNIEDGAFNGCKKLVYDEVFVIIRNVLYSYHGKERKVTIPDGVTTIGRCAFSENESLTSVAIPDSVTSIGYSAFYKCNKLESVTIGKCVTSIGNNAFSGCSSLTAVTIPDSVTSIGDMAFYECESLTSVTIPDSVTSIGNSAFYKCKKLESVAIGKRLTSIGNKTFSECESLTAVNIPDNVTSIGNRAFSFCSSLISVNIPDTVISIGYYAFNFCTNLVSVNITEKVVNIVGNAFWACSKLKKLPAFGYIVDGTKCQWGIFGNEFHYPELDRDIEDEENDGYVENMLDHEDYHCDEEPELITDAAEDFEYFYDDVSVDDYDCCEILPIDYSTKCQFVTQVFLKDYKPKAEKYIKNNISEILIYFIDNDDYFTVKGLLESGKFVTEQNIMKFIDHAVDHTKNGDDIRIQELLISYKSDHFPD